MSNTPSSNPGAASSAGQSTSGADANARKDEKDLEAQVSRLREDVANVAESLKSLAGNRATSAKAQAFALRDDVRETGERYFRQAQDAAGDLEADISERVRAEPIKAVLIAAAVGYFYARIFKN